MPFPARGIGRPCGDLFVPAASRRPSPHFSGSKRHAARSGAALGLAALGNSAGSTARSRKLPHRPLPRSGEAGVRMHMRRVPGAHPNGKVILMKKFALHKTLMLIAALAIGSAGIAGDALARGGGGGGGGGGGFSGGGWAAAAVMAVAASAAAAWAVAASVAMPVAALAAMAWAIWAAAALPAAIFTAGGLATTALIMAADLPASARSLATTITVTDPTAGHRGAFTPVPAGARVTSGPALTSRTLTTRTETEGAASKCRSFRNSVSASAPM